MAWRDKPYECDLCGWQGMLAPTPPLNEAFCPDCCTRLLPRSSRDTCGLTLFILVIVVATLLFLAYSLRRGIIRDYPTLRS